MCLVLEQLEQLEEEEEEGFLYPSQIIAVPSWRGEGDIRVKWAGISGPWGKYPAQTSAPIHGAACSGP
jgi:hypothetical protein